KREAFEKAAEQWLSLATDEGATYDKTLTIDASEVEPQVAWGTNTGMGAPISGHTPIIDEAEDKDGVKRALEYMDLEENKPMTDIEIDHVFIGSCTNSRLRDLRKASAIVKGQKIKDSVKGIVVPGSALVKMQAEVEGLDEIFKEAGFEWRNDGCSACLRMNDVIIHTGGIYESSSNRNLVRCTGTG